MQANVREQIINIFFMQTTYCALQWQQACYCPEVFRDTLNCFMGASGLVNSCLLFTVAVFTLFDDMQ